MLCRVRGAAGWWLRPHATRVVSARLSAAGEEGVAESQGSAELGTAELVLAIVSAEALVMPNRGGDD
jgi:hypothetical protein